MILTMKVYDLFCHLEVNILTVQKQIDQFIMDKKLRKAKMHLDLC